MPSGVFAVQVKQDLGALIVGTPLRILAVIVVAVVLQIVTVRVIHRIIRRTVKRAEAKQQNRAAGAGGTRLAQRAGAIGSVLISCVSILIWLNALLVILPIIGINITPIIASAGVVGIALAFGAQTLVRDYISGIFLIMEDQYGVGDVIQVGAVTGTVEEVALRTTRLRDEDGTLWYLRNGEIFSVGNRSQK
ncbi:MAG: mechanosensitive ion channel [Thermoleophilia bacterium]|nr:mechanosensitive ion channel [Thermoleophilia bacterium]